ncbi:MAG: SUMF1/EgtB/PvdO family nonheme iron enzyme [Planctomycetota bacterium]|jgi:formylglycine-generating enzyme required for sulfatase activity
MSRALLSIVLILALSPAGLAQSSGDEASKKEAIARYRAAMKEGRAAQKKKDWKAAVAAYERALEAKPGDFAAKKALEKARKNLGVLPKGFEKAFILPVLIPAGTFQMGSPKSEAGRTANEGPVHPVKITKPFYLAKYEVTQALWRTVMGDNPSRFPEAGENAPVEKVPWTDCKAFCKKMDLVLPTEAQWEYACRAGTQTPFSFGRTVTVDQVNYHGDYPYAGAPKGINRATTIRVGSFPANAWGLHDMHGNVWEWCEDIYARHFFSKPEATKPDPLCKEGSDLRVVKGGSWIGYSWYCRSANRDGYRENTLGGYVGFRPAKLIPDARTTKATKATKGFQLNRRRSPP